MNNKYIITAGILILIVAGSLGYLWKKGANPVPSVSPTPTPPKEAWETYTNPQLGFSIKYPQSALGLYRCSPNKPFYAPIKVFEDNKNGVTYITEEYYYQAPFSEKLNDYTEPCNKITYSLEMLQNEWSKNDLQEGGQSFNLRSEKTLIGLGLLVKDIKNETELNEPQAKITEPLIIQK